MTDITPSPGKYGSMTNMVEIRKRQVKILMKM